MRFAILGPVEVRDGDQRLAIGGPRQVALLAFLLLHRNRAVSNDELQDALWTEPDRNGASKRLHVAVSRLRNSLAAVEHDAALGPALRTVSGGYMLAVADGELDADTFVAGVARGRALLDCDDAAGAAAILREALGLWRGPVLADVAFEDFAQPEIRRLQELQLTALDARVDADLALGRHGEVIGELEARLARHPGRERVCEQLMLALYRSGRQGDALDAYQRLSAHLDGELGLRPGPALQKLQREVLEHAAWLSADQAVPPGGRRDADLPAPPDPTATQPVEATFPLPPALVPSERPPLVGRAAADAQLAGAYERAASGVRQLVLVCGEPGIGKSRLAMELAHDAYDGGAIVLYGRCDEEPLLPHQPFVEALRHYVRHCPPALLASQVTLISGELRRVVPELAERVPALSQPLAGDPDGARHRLFEAVAAILCEAARRQPLVLLLDDLHWADEATLLLLKYIARYPGEARLLIVGTYRNTDVDDAHPLSSVLAQLVREQLLERVDLGRLDEAAVGELVGWHTGDRAPADLRRMVFEETEGLAFFVVEVARHLSDAACDDAGPDPLRPAEGQRRIPLPEGVTSLIRRRVARLGREATRVLETAAVLGSSFELDVLERLCDVGQDELVEALERAVRAQLVAEPRGGEGRYTFSHTMIRDVLYEAPGQARRALLHRRAAAAIEEAYTGRELPFAELARHLDLAGGAADIARALAFESLAANDALGLLAYEQACGHLRRALDLLDRCGGDPTQCCELTIALGQAQRMAGDARNRETLLRAAAIAAQLGDADRLARAALANHRGHNSSSSGVDPERVRALEAALELVGDGDSSTRANLLAQLAVELVADADGPRRTGLSDAALAIARRVGDPVTLARVLTLHCVAQWHPATLAARTAHMRESLLLAEATGERQVCAYAAYFGYHMALESADLELAEELLAKLRSHARQLRQPTLEWLAAVARIKHDMIVGSPQDVEQRARTAYAVGRRTGQPDAEVWLLGHLFVARLLLGSLGEGEPNLRELYDEPGTAPLAGPEYTPNRSAMLLISACKSALHGEVGAPEDARGHFDVVMGALADLSVDYARLGILVTAAIGCAHLEDVAAAERLHPLLEPYADQFVNTGAMWLGSAGHHLGLLEAVTGRFDDADRRFAVADDAYARLGAVAWRTRCRLDWASVLMRRGGDDDVERARELSEAALTAARELDLGAIAARASAHLAQATAGMDR